LSSLAVFAAIAPLLGLLGTVGGMIKTFEVITQHGTGNARLLADGISEALVTTQVGLAVAIPVLLLHAVLSRQAKKIVAKMEQLALTVLAARVGKV
jgi:biopolymer transport protein ExbB